MMSAENGYRRTVRLIRRRRGQTYLHYHAVYSLFEELIHEPWGGGWRPAADVSETAEAYVVEIDLPGAKAEDLEVTVERRTLRVQGARQVRRAEEPVVSHTWERPAGRFARAFEFDFDIHDAAIETNWRDGVLTITVPKPHRGGEGNHE